MKHPLSTIFKSIMLLLIWQKWRLREKAKIRYFNYQILSQGQAVQSNLMQGMIKEEQKPKCRRKCVIAEVMGYHSIMFTFYKASLNFKLCHVL